MSDTSLKEKTAKGLFWGGFSNGIQQLLNLGFGIVLARLLDASDYGMVGMLTIFSAIAAALQEGGFISALTNRKETLHKDYNAVFWFSLMCSTTIYILLFFAAPLIADFYDTPELIPLSRLSFLGFVISSMSIAPRAYLFKNLRIKDTTVISISSLIVSGIVGITLAANGFAYWGIALQSISFITVMTILNFYFSHWRPRFRFDFTPIKEMIGFSSKIIITNIFTIINNNLFSVLLGKFYSEREVGNFTQANKWNGMGHTRHAGIELGIERTDYNHYHGEVAAQCRYLATVMYLGSIYSRHQSVLQPAHQPGTFFYLYVEHHQLEPAANSSCMRHIPIRVGMDAAYFRHYQYRLAVCMVPFCQEGDRIKTARYAERHLSLSLPIHCTRSINSLCHSAHRKPILKYGSQNHYGSWALCTGFVETTIYHLPGKH